MSPSLPKRTLCAGHLARCTASMTEVGCVEQLMSLRWPILASQRCFIVIFPISNKTANIGVYFNYTLFHIKYNRSLLPAR